MRVRVELSCHSMGTVNGFRYFTACAGHRAWSAKVPMDVVLHHNSNRVELAKSAMTDEQT